MERLRMLAVAWSLFFGAQSLLACCKESPKCIHPCTDMIADGEDPGCIFNCVGACLDTCLWIGCFPFAAGTALFCPHCGSKKGIAGREAVDHVRTSQPRSTDQNLSQNDAQALRDEARRGVAADRSIEMEKIEKKNQE